MDRFFNTFKNDPLDAIWGLLVLALWWGFVWFIILGIVGNLFL